MIHRRALRIDPSLRDRLYAAASEAFACHGYGRASLNAILAAAGMGKSSFFYYFVDKEDLFASVIEAALVRISAAAGPTDRPSDPAHFWDEAAAMVGRWGTAMDAEPGFVGLLRALQPMRRTASPRLLHVMDEARGVYRELLARGIELGEVREDLDVDTMMGLIDAVDLAIDEAFHRNPAPNVSDIQTHRMRMVDLVRRLIVPENRR